MSLTRKEWALVGVVFLFLFLIVNAVSHYIIRSYLQVSIYGPEYESERNRFVKNRDRAKVHPYYGLNSSTEQGFDSLLSSENSFIRVSPRPSENEIKILVLGGSVATHLSIKREDVTEDYLLARKINERFNTDRFVVYNSAFGGGKQPQQYFKLLYLDLLGFAPDLILNYDGFNEIAVPFGENQERNLNAIYPRSFDQLVIGSATEGECIALNNWLLSFNSLLPVVELAKWIYVRDCHNEVTGSERRIDFTSQALFEVEQSNYQDRVRAVWSESSNKMFEFALTRDIPYLHILQPNQYLEGSKPLSQQETRDFYNLTMYREPVAAYYGLLSLNDLLALYKLDQRYLFESEERTVYTDNCCHLNNLGMEIIIDNILDQFDSVFAGLMAR